MSSPRPPAPPVDFDVPPPPTAICMDCETTVLLVGGKLPMGWEPIQRRWGSEARCPSCRRARRPAAPPTRLAKSPTARLLSSCAPVDEAPATDRLYAGARVHHWLVGGNAVLRIHGGAAPRATGRDERVHFLATPADLDELIIRLGEIRALLDGENK